MEVGRILREDPQYPDSLSVFLGEDSPAALSYIGNVELLNLRPLALFCSNRCPGRLILKTYDLAQKLLEAGAAVVSGFHSPVERECLNIILRGRNPIIICPARGIERMRVPASYRKTLDAGRLLFASPFAGSLRRGTKATAAIRNAFAAALASEVFVAHAQAGSATEELCRHILAWKKTLYVCPDPTHAELLALGATPINEYRFFQDQSRSG